MKTITAVNLVKKGIAQGLTNDEIRDLPQFRKLEQRHGFKINDRAIDGLRGSMRCTGTVE